MDQLIQKGKNLNISALRATLDQNPESASHLHVFLS